MSGFCLYNTNSKIVIWLYMRFALFNNEHVEATPDIKDAICPGCGAPVIAKCGTQKVHHWAHRNTKICDNWWEPETQWHRNWKDKFPVEWQEIFLPDKQTGELHIADVRTEHGLVIEFQHSHIKPEERISREKFYKNMVWVVDGTRLTRDYPRFVKASKEFHKVRDGIFQHDFADECFPRQWLYSDVPVIFDFLGDESSDTVDERRRKLYCLFPDDNEFEAIFAVISRKAFINAAMCREWSSRIQFYLDERRREKLEHERRREKERKQMYAYYARRRYARMTYKYPRRRL